MTHRVSRAMGAIGLVLVLAGADLAAQKADAARAEALICLARAARDRGDAVQATKHFREAARLQTFEGPLLVEYFWAAHQANAHEAPVIADRVLSANPAERAVRDGAIGLAVKARDEARARRLSAEGARVEPGVLLWSRRLGESALRVGAW